MRGYVKIFTYGCQMNDLDTRKMYSDLARSGWCPTEDLHQADLVILNTCTVRQKAHEKALSNLGRLRRYKRCKPHLIIAVTGCVAQELGAELPARMPHVDIVLGTHQLHRLREAVARPASHSGPFIDTRYGVEIPSLETVPEPEFMDAPHRCALTIMQGCNNYCAYCIVPFVRGPEISRDWRSILSEARTYAARGVKEILLLGQNVNSYAGGLSFPELLHQLHAIEGLERIRFTTSHPKDMSAELIACFAALPKLCSHVHLPFQSGSDSVLKSMQRGYTRAHYLGLIEALRGARPDMAFSADVIVGFPGERDTDFTQTLMLLREVGFDGLYSFRYSPRPGTAAARLIDDVPLEMKAHRLSELQALQRQITLENHLAQVGRTCRVLVDGLSSRHADQVCGRTSGNTIVNFPGKVSLVGTSVEVRITRANPNSLTGKQLEGRH